MLILFQVQIYSRRGDKVSLAIADLFNLNCIDNCLAKLNLKMFRSDCQLI